jgi:hypothetical protein
MHVQCAHKFANFHERIPLGGSPQLVTGQNHPSKWVPERWFELSHLQFYLCLVNYLVFWGWFPATFPSIPSVSLAALPQGWSCRSEKRPCGDCSGGSTGPWQRLGTQGDSWKWWVVNNMAICSLMMNKWWLMAIVVIWRCLRKWRYPQTTAFNVKMVKKKLWWFGVALF